MNATDRRRRAAEAGHKGDESAARAFLDDDEAPVRATALGALARMGALRPDDLDRALADPAPMVRKRACEEARVHAAPDLLPLLADADPAVVEAAAWAIGERGDARDDVVDALAHVVQQHADALCREAGVAALGALGAPRGLLAILRATGDKPAIRRRAVIALAPFEGEEVDAALQKALKDRDWQVRQAAEDLLAPNEPR